MRLLPLLTAAATPMILVVSPAAAQPDDTARTPRIAYEGEAGYAFVPATRESWLADCRRRLGVEVDPVQDECEAYLANYYARYAYGGYPAAGYGAWPYPAAAYAQPVVQPTPQCTETIEYVYDDIPARPEPRKRYIPRREKVVPDKRVPIR